MSIFKLCHDPPSSYPFWPMTTDNLFFFWLQPCMRLYVTLLKTADRRLFGCETVDVGSRSCWCWWRGRGMGGRGLVFGPTPPSLPAGCWGQSLICSSGGAQGWPLAPAEAGAGPGLGGRHKRGGGRASSTRPTPRPPADQSHNWNRKMH